jgi:glycosyltransferase involved in cell wall biosynthesis
VNLTFWTNIVSPHQAAYIRELANVHRVTIVADKRITADRVALGWDTPDCGRAEVVIEPNRASALKLAHAGDRSVHLLSGYRGCTLSGFVLREAVPDTRVGIIAEGCDFRGFPGSLRKIRCRWDVWRNRSRVDFALAMGFLGERWWRNCGLPRSRVFPFGYVVEKPGIREPQIPGGQSEVRVIYLGQFTGRKGVDVLLRALALCKQAPWQADLVGSGPLEAMLRKMGSDLGIAGCVRFLKAQQQSEAMRMVAQSDLLVLPSHYDGWGAVVNEALMRGVPVICTSACGASDLIRCPWLGSVVAPGSTESLRRALTGWITRGPRTAALSDKIRAWSRCIEGESVASYFLRVLDHVYEGGPRPVAPWRIEADAEAAPEANPGLTCAGGRFGTDSFPAGLGK